MPRTIGAAQPPVGKAMDPRGEIDPTTGIEVAVIKNGDPKVLGESSAQKPVTVVDGTSGKDMNR